ncbi:hypothetical protein VNO77_39022 [Canavalia gladiata]|uniref:Uncharacterized protein n=1 Tax=Canavalia gladiata TaxID=3824 RepID=A0AAN9PVG1_CANGL
MGSPKDSGFEGYWWMLESSCHNELECAAELSYEKPTLTLRGGLKEWNQTLASKVKQYRTRAYWELYSTKKLTPLCYYIVNGGGRGGFIRYFTLHGKAEIQLECSLLFYSFRLMRQSD